MQRSKSFAVLFLVVAFIAGIAVGITAEKSMSHNARERRAHMSSVDRMAADLDLNAAQRRQVDSIMTRRRIQMREIFKPLHPQIDSLQKIAKAVSDSTHEQLKRVLTPEQGKKLDAMRDKARKASADARARRDAPTKFQQSPQP